MLKIIKILRQLLRIHKILPRKMAWRRYSRLADVHNFKILRNSVSMDAQIIYLTESPFTVINIDNNDLSGEKFKDKYVYAFFDKPENCECLSWVNKSAWLSLMDHHVSMPDAVNENFKKRKHKAVLVRSDKNSHPGHKLRSKLQVNQFLDIIETTGQNISDLRTVYEQYQYVVIIENVCFPGFVSEQIWGAIKSGCIPIYNGDIKTLDKYGLSSVVKFSKVFSIDALEITHLPNLNDISFSVKNFEILKEIRQKSLLEFLAYPTMFLIRGER